MKTIKIGDDPSVYATGNDNCKTSTTGTSDQKPKELDWHKQWDYLLNQKKWKNPNEVNGVLTKFVEDTLTQQRTELLEEILEENHCDLDGTYDYDGIAKDVIELIENGKFN